MYSTSLSRTELVVDWKPCNGDQGEIPYALPTGSPQTLVSSAKSLQGLFIFPGTNYFFFFNYEYLARTY